MTRFLLSHDESVAALKPRHDHPVPSPHSNPAPTGQPPRSLGYVAIFGMFCMSIVAIVAVTAYFGKDLHLKAKLSGDRAVESAVTDH